MMKQETTRRPETGIVTCSMDVTDIPERCLAGEVVIVRNLLDKIGWQHRINDIISNSIAQNVNESVAAELSRNGFEYIHYSVKTDEAQEIVGTVERKLARVSPAIHYSLLRSGILGNQPLWALRRPLIRIHYPFDETWRYRKTLQRFKSTYGDGRLTPLRPHRDSWFFEPAECINVWISITPVGQGNSMCFFPETYGLKMPFEPSQGVLRTQQVGRAESIELSPGDALFMHAEHLHASELNSTNRTRWTLSLRVSPVSPKRSSKQPHRYSKINRAYPWTFLSLHAYWGFAARKVELLKNKLFGSRKLIPNLTSQGEPGTDNASACVDIEKLSVTQLEIDIPRPLSQQRCIVRLQDGSILTFNRRCPHQGADLSLANVEDHKLRCPWHNLEFDLRNGASHCESLADLDVRQCTVIDGRVVANPADEGTQTQRA